MPSSFLRKYLLSPATLAFLFLGLCLAAMHKTGNYLIPCILLIPEFLSIVFLTKKAHRLKENSSMTSASEFEMLVISLLASVTLAFVAGIFVAGGIRK